MEGTVLVNLIVICTFQTGPQGLIPEGAADRKKGSP